MFKRLTAMALALLALSVEGALWEPHLRFRLSPRQSAVLNPGLVLRWESRLEGAASVGLDRTGLERVGYRLQWSSPRWGPLGADARMAHLLLPREQAAATSLAAWGALEPTLGPLEVRFRVGWYERLSQARGASILPLPRSDSLREHDFLFDLRLSLPVGGSTWAEVETASFDEFELYNLNGPFFQGAVRWSDAAGQWRIFGRYRLLLGFGRLNEWVTGLQWSPPI